VFYLEPLLEMPQVEVVGIADPDPLVVARYRERLGCTGDTDFRELCRRERPDFVFALGRHCDMAATARFLIEEGIPFAIEKPAGLNAAEVAELAALAEKRNAFAAVAFVLRNGGFLAALEPILEREELSYASFRFVAGPAARYLDSGCSWMLDPATSGGGCTLNLGVHFFDICQMIMGGENLTVASSLMSNAAWGFPVEDYSAVTLVNGSKTCVIESGYLFPAPTNHFDMHYSVRTSGSYAIAWGPNALEIRDYAGNRQELTVSTTNVPHYRDFTIDVLERWRTGRPPLANLTDRAAAFALIDAAYRVSQPLRVI
jgi:predicted dehydrogenase